MEPKNKPLNNGQQNKPDSNTSKNGGNNPKKPGNDPDQTPDREVTKTPKAKPEVTKTPDKKKIGF